jgi:phage-related protein
MEQLRPLPLSMWRSASGNEPKRVWFKSLPEADRKVLGTDLRQLQFGWPVGMPLVRGMSNGLWELRSTLPSRREARVLFAVVGEYISVLHGFIKKTQKTPDHKLALACKRLKEMYR